MTLAPEQGIIRLSRHQASDDKYHIPYTGGKMLMTKGGAPLLTGVIKHHYKPVILPFDRTVDR